MSGISPDAILAATTAVGLAVLGGVVHLSLRLGKLDALANRELKHNGGSTLKDNARDGAESAKRAVLIADEARAQGAMLRKDFAEATAVSSHKQREADTALALVAARDEHMRVLLGRIQGDLTRLVGRVNQIEGERLTRDNAVAAALHESLDVALVIADAATPPPGETPA